MTQDSRTPWSRTLRPASIGLLALAIGVGTASSASAASFNPDNGNSYEVVAAALNWTDARDAAAARTLGGSLCAGHLATITSAEEQAFLVNTFGAGLNLKWLGAIQPDGQTSPSAGWTWITGEPWGYTNWNSGEPNDGGGGENNYEDALAFWLTGDGKWNDAPETYNYGASGGYVVEYECRQVSVDVMPGDDVSSINNDGKGLIPVAILTTETFDAASVDPLSVTLDGAAVKMKGKSGQAGSLEDVDGDGDLDLVVRIQDTDGTYAAGDTTAYVTAKTHSGEDVKGSDAISIVPATS